MEGALTPFFTEVHRGKIRKSQKSGRRLHRLDGLKDRG